MAITVKSFVRAVATTTKDPSSAQAIAGLLILMFGICSGFSPTLATINRGFHWITYINVRLLIVAVYRIVRIFDPDSICGE
jgi:ABC-type multidrug transport system permease subunit